MESISENTNKKREFWTFFTVLTFLSLFMVLWSGPLSEYPGHDFYFHFGRFETLINALKESNYPIYLDYSTLEGYGYFTKAFYPDLVLLPFAILAMATNSIFAFNAMVFTYTLLCGLFMYRAVNYIFKCSFAAAISAIVYTFSTYHFYDWYNRTALGEAISFAFLPLVFLGLYHILRGDYKKWYILVVGYSLLIYTHLLSSFLAFIVIALFLLLAGRYLVKEPKRILYLSLATGVTLLIVSSYLFPMIEQMFSDTLYYSIRNNETGYTKQTIGQMFWGVLTGIAYEGDTWHMRNVSGTGILPLFLIIFRLFVKEKTKSRDIADICLLVGVILLLMISSFFPWGKLPLGFIQFPWRLYEFVVFFLSISGAFYLSAVLVRQKYRVVSASAILIFTLMTMIIANNSYKFITKAMMDESPEWYTMNPSLENYYHLGNYEYLPTKVSSLGFIAERGDGVKCSKPDTEILDFTKDNGVISFNIKTDSKERIELPFIYYKGYKAVNAELEEFLVGRSDHGLVEALVDKSTDIMVYYGGTITQKISWIVSLLSVLVLCVYIFIYRNKNRVI